MNQDENWVRTDGVTPDALMAHFQGSGLKKIVIFTLAVHMAVLLVFSLPLLWRKAIGEDVSKLSEDQRMDKAILDAAATLQKIAAANDIDPQALSRRLNPGGARAAPPPPPTEEPAAPAAGPAEPDRPKSAYETNLEVKTEGPAMPSVDPDKRDIF